MKSIQEMLLRRFLKPQVVSDIPGRLRIKFSQYKRLPKEAYPYMHYAEEALEMLPGVTKATVNVYTGSILIEYDRKKTSATKVLRWIDIIVDTDVKVDMSYTGERIPSEQELYELGKKVLTNKLKEV